MPVPMTPPKDIFNAFFLRICEADPRIADNLPAPARAQELAQLSHTIGQPVPDELEYLLSIHNGSGALWIFPDWVLMSTRDIETEWLVWNNLNETEFLSAKLTSEPIGPIQNSQWWRKGWIPIGSDFSGNHLCLDLEPAEGGQVGQVITFDHDSASRVWLADSLSAYVADVLACLFAGTLIWDAEQGAVVEVNL